MENALSLPSPVCEAGCKSQMDTLTGYRLQALNARNTHYTHRQLDYFMLTSTNSKTYFLMMKDF